MYSHVIDSTKFLFTMFTLNSQPQIKTNINIFLISMTKNFHEFERNKILVLGICFQKIFAPKICHITVYFI